MPNTSDWDNADFLMDLGIALFTAAQANKALPVPVKEAVEAYLKERGWKTSFDAVRRQTMQWDANVHEDILICMFQHLKLSNEDWTSVMAELQKLGYTFTESALRQHVQKLRKNRDTNASNALSAIQAAGAGSATTTPRKKATTTPRKRKNAKNTPAEEDDAEDEKMKLKQENDDEGGDELVSPSPMKRAKRTPKPEPMDEELEAEVEGEI
ncbi:hypothetical protein B0J15DRAFT_521082 [Fusarium solani]|uniref:Uncharacterized protein n=2 Tax=Fusarium solani species complex TaxID=232080 RepID=A0A9P9L0W7_FUSSL|nr:uncharacterized protein B0J15DRAFT_521082 [Fusarium solani]KAH7272116.1 hypothetical protein B0J15DRAFT_521082 [Fusarium solani]